MNMAGTSEPDPLVVRPNRARKMLGDPSPAYFWGKILPDLRSFLRGKARWIEVQSIRDYVARHLEEDRDKRWHAGPGRPQSLAARLAGRRGKAPAPPARRRGGPRKAVPAQPQIAASTG